jgi:inward rectifier potassium channel
VRAKDGRTCCSRLGLGVRSTGRVSQSCKLRAPLRLERAHIPIFPLFWTLMHVLDERSPLHGYDPARAIEANAQVFVTLEARDPTLATMVHDIRYYAAENIRFAMRYTHPMTTAEDGTPTLDLTRIGELEPDVGDRQEQGWTEREEERG